ncbi:hypothetical protein V8E51_003897 [Hyaloscypha variabilis]
MPLDFSVEAKSYCNTDEIAQAPSPVDAETYLCDQQQPILNWQTLQQHTILHNSGVWPDDTPPPSSCDISSPQAGQKSMIDWEAADELARSDISYQQEIGLAQNLYPTQLSLEDLPFEFITTASVTRSGAAISERRKKQNRESQRAFRARERTRVQKLEERLRTLTQQYRELEQAYSRLKNNSKRHLEEIDIKEEVTESCIPL